MTGITDRLRAPLRFAWQRRAIDGLRVRHVDLRERGLELGVRILVASDVHARSDWFPRPLVARLVDEINRQDGVDFVALLGDFVGDDVTAIDWSAEEYARIEAPVAAVLGNHDHWCDAAYVEGVLAETGARVLTNRSLPVRELVPGASTSTWLGGIDSCWTRRGSTGPGADPVAAFAEMPADAEAIVLGHEPWLATMHAHALHLAGHTHCGQVRTPVFGDWSARLHMPRYSRPWPCWLHEIDLDGRPELGELPPNRRTRGDRRWVYTTAGVGYSTVDVRMFCPPEIVVVDT